MQANSLPQPSSQTTADLCIALLIHSLRGGGAERLISQLASRWSHSNQVHLVTWAPAQQDQYPLPNSVVRWGLDLQSDSRGLLQGILANRRRVISLRQTLQEISPDQIISFCDQMNIVTLEAARGLPSVPVWIAEHSDPRHQRLSRLWELWRSRSYPRCTGAVALTEDIAQAMSQWIPKERIAVIPPALPDVAPATAKTEVAANGCRTILYLGRLSSEKRVDLLISAWESLHQPLVDWQIKIVGDGPLRSELENQARRLPRVEFVGWSSQPEAYLQSSDLFVLCSRYEGFPVALLEALRHGLPSVTTRCTSAIDQLLASGLDESLMAIPGDSVKALSQAILELAQDAQRRQRLSQAAQQVAAQYTWEKTGPLWDKLLVF